MIRMMRLAICLAPLWAGAAMAQTDTVAPPQPPAMITPPPPGTLATIRTSHSVSPNGTRIDKQSSSYRDSTGVAEDKTTVKTTVPAPPPPVQTTTTTRSTTTQTTQPPP